MKKSVVMLLAASGLAVLGATHFVVEEISVRLPDPSVTEVTEVFEIEDVKPEVDIEVDIEEVVEKKVVTEEINKEIPYEVTYIYDDSLEKGIEKVTKEGINGSVTYQYTYEYENDVLVNESKEEISRVNPTHKTVVIGTKEISDGGYFDDALAKQIFNLSNKALTKQNPNKKSPTWSNELKQPANIRAKEIVRSFSHTRPNGSEWYTVSSLVYAENLAVGYQTAQEVVDAWLASPGHKANIMHGYDIMTISVYVDEDGIMYVAQLFG